VARGGRGRFTLLFMASSDSKPLQLLLLLLLLLFQCRAKCGLFLAYCCAFGSIAGAVVVLLLLKQQGADLAIGVVSGSTHTCVRCVAHSNPSASGMYSLFHVDRADKA